MVRAELRQRLRLIGRDTHDGDIEIIELFQGIAEIAGFLGAARGIGAGVEVDQYALACIIGEGNGVSGVVGKRKSRGGISNVQTVFSHGSHLTYRPGCTLLGRRGRMTPLRANLS